MEKTFEKTFFENYFDECFEQFIGDLEIYLRNNNEYYQQLLERKYRILSDCPKLAKILDGNSDLSLSESDSKYIREYELILMDIYDFQQKEMFLKGMKEMFYLFSEMV